MTGDSRNCKGFGRRTNLAAGVIPDIACAIFLCLFTSIAHAEPADLPSGPGRALPGQPCRIGGADLPPQWSEVDRWAWREICEGRPADFDEDLKEEFDPTGPEHQNKWSDERRMLSPGFLETVLFHQPFRSAIPYWGVRIKGAVFSHAINFEGGQLDRPIVLANSAFERAVRLGHVVTSSSLSFNGSSFVGELDMGSISVGGSLLMRGAEFQEVILKGAKISGQLSVIGSTFRGNLNMNAVSVGGSLLMNGPTEPPPLSEKVRTSFQEVDLIGADIGGSLSTNGAEFRGKLIMDSISVDGTLIMQQAAFDVVDLSGANIGGEISMVGSAFQGKLDMNSISVGQSLLMGQHAESPPMLEEAISSFQEVDLKEADIGGQISMVGSAFQGRLDMGSISVGQSLLMRKGTFREVVLLGANVGGQVSMIKATVFQDGLIMEFISIGQGLLMREGTFREVDLIFSNIRGSLDVRGAELGKLNLTGAQIDDELVLGLPENLTIQWKHFPDGNGTSSPPMLTLQNTKVSALQDTINSWPPELQLEMEGFTYDRLGGLQAGGKEMPHQRGSEWYVDWLALDQSYSPQPYKQLADVLETSGHEFMANDILFAGRNRELKESWPHNKLKWLGLSALGATIGYGYGWRYFLSVLWIVAFTAIGCLVLRCEPNRPNKTERLGFWYSLDMLLPVIRLREEHYKVDLSNTYVRRYFYIHKLIGYILVFFVIAGLAGLTQ